MTTPERSVEGVEEVAVKLWNIALDEDNKNARQEFRDVLHQELQKARIEEKEIIKSIIRVAKDSAEVDRIASQRLRDLLD